MRRASARPTKPRRRSGVSSAPSSPAPKRPSPKVLPSNANCNNSASRARTPEKASPPTTKSAKPVSARNSHYWNEGQTVGTAPCACPVYLIGCKGTGTRRCPYSLSRSVQQGDHDPFPVLAVKVHHRALKGGQLCNLK